VSDQKGYSPLRRWLRQERAGDHRRWSDAERCPVCETTTCTCIAHIETTGAVYTSWECDNGHAWTSGATKRPMRFMGSRP